MIRVATPLDIALLILLAALYGSAFSAIKIAVPETGAYLLVLARVVIGFGVLAPYAWLRGWHWPTGAKNWASLALLCVFNLLLPFFLVSWAQLHLNASLMALLMGASPFFALVTSHIATGDDRMTLGKVIAVVIGFLGVGLVLGRDAFSGLDGQSWSFFAPFAAILASFFYAVSGLLVRRIDGVRPTQLATLVLGCSGLGLLLALPLVPGNELQTLTALSSDALWAVLYLGLLTTGGAYILRYHLIRAVGMSFFGMSLYLVPLFGIAIAALLLKEQLSITLFIGLGCILAGLTIARIASAREKRDATA